MSSNSSGTYGLSPEQLSAVIGTENVFIKACPGSGKTRSVAARVAWMHEKNSKLALLSFTRIGAGEISRAVLKDHGVAIAGDSFVGTIQSFLQRYILTPFAHLVTGSSTGVRIEPERVDALDPTGIRTADFKFCLDGRLAPVVGNSLPSNEILDAIKSAKLSAARQGFVGLEDDVYWSYRVLSSHPDIAHALATRFDEVIVDEAQDLDMVQIECLRLLKNGGLPSLVLVGDYDQTIYEWRGSDPDLCERFAKEVGLTARPFRENYRSSQVICNLAASFRSSPEPDRAVGKYANCELAPRIILYAPGLEPSLPGILERLVQEHNVSADSIAVLVRTQAMKEKIKGMAAPTARGAIRTLLDIKVSTNGPSFEAYKEVERLLLRKAFGSSSPQQTLDQNLVRSTAIALVDSLPPLAGSLLDWASSADGILSETAKRLAPALDPPQTRHTFPGSWAEIAVGLTAEERHNDKLRVDTVHAFKGESIDAVMLVAAEPTERQRARGLGDAVSWSKHLGRFSSNLSEDARVAYVAVTRARQLMVLALPEDTHRSTVEKFLIAGFEMADQ